MASSYICTGLCRLLKDILFQGSAVQKIPRKKARGFRLCFRLEGGGQMMAGNSRVTPRGTVGGATAILTSTPRFLWDFPDAVIDRRAPVAS